MKDLPLSNCEREFILNGIHNKERIDFRPLLEFRQTNIQFGSTWGSCQVRLGNTRVFSQVHAEIDSPRHSRPKDGIININVELSPMAHPSFEAWRQTDDTIEINRILERTIKESHAVDTESLCIIAGEKVWIIRVTLTILNHDGNLIDTCCLATMAALSHFRKNEVEVDHKIIKIIPPEDHAPTPLNIVHIPLCVTFAFYHRGDFMLIDPCEREERVMEGRLVVGVNKHREVCALQATGSMLILQDQVVRCISIATRKVSEIVKILEAALADDKSRRIDSIPNFSTKFLLIKPCLSWSNCTQEDTTMSVEESVTQVSSMSVQDSTGDTGNVSATEDGQITDLEVEMEKCFSKTSRKSKSPTTNTTSVEGVSSGSEEETITLPSTISTNVTMETVSQVKLNNYRLFTQTPSSSKQRKAEKKKRNQNKNRKKKQSKQ